MSIDNQYENDLYDFFEKHDIAQIRAFIRRRVDEKIATGFYDFNKKHEVKQRTWLAYLANYLFHNSEKEKNFADRWSIIERTNFEPVKPPYQLREEQVDKFKSVENFLGPNAPDSRASTCQLTIALFDIQLSDFDPGTVYTEPKAGQKPENAVQKQTRKPYSKTLALSLAVSLASIALIIIYNGSINQQKVPNESGSKGIEASRLFSSVVSFNSENVQVPDTLLMVAHKYAWKTQSGTSIHLDSLAIRLTIKNYTSDPFFFDKVILRTYAKEDMNDSYSLRTSDILLNPGLSFNLDNNKTNWNYLVNILTEPQMDQIPPYSEATSIIMIKCKGNWKSQFMPFEITLEGRHSGNTKFLSSGATFKLGVDK